MEIPNGNIMLQMFVIGYLCSFFAIVYIEILFLFPYPVFHRTCFICYRNGDKSHRYIIFIASTWSE